MKATRQTHLKVNNSEIVEFTTEREIEIINDKIDFSSYIWMSQGYTRKQVPLTERWNNFFSREQSK